MALPYHRDVSVSTAADSGDRNGWSISDAVTRLRIWGTETTFDLMSHDRWLVGSSPECGLVLHDSSNLVSRRHAELVLENGAWTLRDLQSRNGVRLDGELRLTFHVTPGIEVEIGGVRLIAESPRSIALRDVLARLLGWSAQRRPDVDAALRAVREMASMQHALVLRGDGKIGGVVQQLHRNVLADVPFVDRSDGRPIAELPRVALLYLDAKRLPADLRFVIAASRLPESRARIVVSAETGDEVAYAARAIGRIATIEIPSLQLRRAERHRLFTTFADEAAAGFGFASAKLRDDEQGWLEPLEVAALADLEEIARRVVAIRVVGVTAGARLLGISHVALLRWAQRRDIPT